MIVLAIAYTVALVLAIIGIYTIDAPQNCGTWHDTARAADIVADLMLDAVAPAHRRTMDAPSPEATYPAAIQIPSLMEIARRTARTPRPSAPARRYIGAYVMCYATGNATPDEYKRPRRIVRPSAPTVTAAAA